jgi:ectoine hydroxylase-related dioxygenase (phytanoyl-CoA dioxygenase family)
MLLFARTATIESGADMNLESVIETIDAQGYSCPVGWATAHDTQLLAAMISTDHDCEIVRNPHLSQQWARAVVTAPMLTGVVESILGPNAAVENGFLVIKWPDREFIVPAHQDGIDDYLELIPGRSLCCWVAITDATDRSGCLQVVPRSQRWGYLPYGPESGTRCGLSIRANLDGTAFVHVPLTTSQAIFFDPRLVHRSGPNRTDSPRIGLNIRYVTADGLRRGTPDTRPGWMFLDLP